LGRKDWPNLRVRACPGIAACPEEAHSAQRNGGSIEAVGSALSDTAGEATFYAHTYSGENTLSASFARRVPGARGVRVPVTTIDDFCAAREIAPTLLKIDIEGFEFHALKGARQTLRRHHPTVIVELHPMVWKEIGLSRERVTKTLAELGYHARPLEGQEDLWAEYGHAVLEAAA
jgi:FkbM family methyltransferase